MQKDSVVGTIVVAAALCICCSILVAGAAVVLKEKQTENKRLDIKKNMLLASGLLKDARANKEQILEAYKKIQPMVVSLETGQVVESAPENFDQRKAGKNPETNFSIPKNIDIAGIKTRSKLAQVYKVVENGELQMYILPVHGKGLWSTLYGFLALSQDLSTVKGLGFYEHAETPGLGGEVDNPSWKALWVGKKLFDGEGKPKIEVVKGAVAGTDPDKDYKVDGLSGATITSNGVTNLLKFWLGENGFGPFIRNQAAAKGEYGQL